MLPSAVDPGKRSPAPSAAPVVYEVRDLEFAYEGGFTLRIDELLLRAGERLAIIGQNGSGKTTLLRILAGLQAPRRSARLQRPGEHRREPLRESEGAPGAAPPGPPIGFLRQQPYLFRGSVVANLAYPLRLRKRPRPEIERRVTAMLARLDLASLAPAPAQQLSGGEQKRLALGRVLIGQPAVLFLDEPDAHLDGHSRRVIERVILGSSTTVLLTTHDLRFAHRIAERVLHLRGGRISPGLPENVLIGTAVAEDGELIETEHGLRIHLGEPVPGATVKVSVDPRHIVLSREPLDSSMRNQYRGEVVGVHDQNGNVWLEIECGERLTAIVSRESYARLGLNLHQEVWLSFKASAVDRL